MGLGLDRDRLTWRDETMATATKRRSLHIFCPECNTDCEITIDLNNLDGNATCQDCSETFSLAEAREKLAASLAKLDAVLAWIDAAPVTSRD